MIVCWTNTRLVRVKLKVIFPVRHSSSSDQSRRASLKALGLSDDATQVEIREAYLQLTKESHPDVNKDPKASEEFHRVKIAYDRLKSIYGEEEKQSCERREEERRQGRGNTFKSGEFKSWSKDDWMNKVAEEGRKRQQYHNEENKWQERLARNQRGKGVFTDEQLNQMLKKSKLKDDNFWDDFAKMEKLEGLLPDKAEKGYSSFEKFFVAQLDKIFPPKKDLVTVTSKHPKARKKEGGGAGMGELPFKIFTKALLGSWVVFARSVFRLPVLLMLGIVWTVVFVLISIELMQSEEPHPDSIEYQYRVDQGTRSNPGLYSMGRGTLEDIQLKEPAIQPTEAIRSVSDSKERLKGL